MTNLNRIPTPMVQHLRRFRFQVLPVVVFIGILVGTATLWDHQRNRQWATGEMDDVSIDLSFGSDGKLVAVSDPPKVMATVKIGDLIARLDDEPITAELAAMNSELQRLNAELEATAVRLVAERTDRQYDRLMAARRLALDVERHSLDLLDRRAQLQTNQIELLRTETEVNAVEQAYALGGETTYYMQSRRLLRDVAAKRVEGEAAAIKEAVIQLASLKERLAGQDALGEPDTQADLLLEPIRHAIAAQEARVKALNLQREALSIRSPINGIITAVRYQPGQAVQAGVPVVKVTSTAPGDVISYLREGHEYRPRKGEKALVRSRSGPRPILTGIVQEVGPEYERIPTHQLRDPNRPEWGVPVRISLADNSSLLPGELVDVTFSRTE